MIESKRRVVHTPEFKAKVGLEVLRGVKTINEIGQDYGVHPTQVGLWKKEIQEQAKTLFAGKRGPKPVAARQEPDLLNREIGKLKVELDWLKKSPGYTCRNQAGGGGAMIVDKFGGTGKDKDKDKGKTGAAPSNC